MRPLLKPALRRFWRDRSTVQFGVDPDNATVITGLDPALIGILDELTGERSRSDILHRAQQRGADPEAAERLLALLAEAGVLDSARPGMRLSGLAPSERTRLLPDLRSLSLSGQQNGVPHLVRRRKTAVAVYGAGRVGGTAAVSLAAAGVGRLLVSDRSTTSETDLAPGGLDTVEPDTDRATGIRNRIGRFARSSRTSTTDDRRTRPELAIVAQDEEPDRGLVSGLIRLGIPHLVVRVVEQRGIVGPFVLPGRTSCVRCTDLYRADRDPRYPRLLAQTLTEQPVTRPCDVVLASLVGNLAALHVLQYLAGDLPDSCGATVEVDAGTGRQRRRRWPAHPECGCHWEHLAEQREYDGSEDASTDRITPGASTTPSGKVGGADTVVDAVAAADGVTDAYVRTPDRYPDTGSAAAEFDWDLAHDRLFPE